MEYIKKKKKAVFQSIYGLIVSQLIFESSENMAMSSDQKHTRD